MAGSHVFRAALVDLSGTLHVGSTPLPGAVLALQRLREAGVAVRFVTNTTKQTVSELLETLQGLGFVIPAHEVHSGWHPSSPCISCNASGSPASPPRSSRR